MTKSDFRQELIDAMDVVDARAVRARLGADGRKFKSDFEAEGRSTEVIAPLDLAEPTGVAQR